MQSGQKVRDYVFDERIGVGGMGEVWRALHTVLQLPVAIKVMDPRLASDPEFEQRFVQEARAQAALHHPRILHVMDFFSEEDVYYLVMRLVDGVTLETRLSQSKGPLALAEAVTIARDVLEGLDYAHQRGIIHRDVKPSNILLDASGHAYVHDFGIALLVGQDRRTRTGASLGTPHYMSPEQIQRPRTIDHRADVYSAGCVIYEMLAGRPPFDFSDEDADTSFLVQQAHMNQAPEPVRKWNPAVPPGIDAVMLRALEKDPGQRWNGCGEFLRALGVRRSDTLVEDSVRAPSPAPSVPLPPLAPPAPTPLPVPPSQVTRPLSWVPSAVLGGLALVVLIAVLTYGWPAVQTPYQSAPPPSPTPSENEGPPSPSFDCGFARLAVEKMICADSDIAQLDVEMAGLYHTLEAESTDRKRLRAEQLKWMTQERNLCRTNECLAQVYRERIAALRRLGLSENAVNAESLSTRPWTSPSFDCRFARLIVEKMICADSDIAQLDVEMAGLYHALEAEGDEQKYLRAEQLGWMTQERNLCRTNECLAQVYRERIAALRRLDQVRK